MRNGVAEGPLNGFAAWSKDAGSPSLALRSRSSDGSARAAVSW